MSLFHYSIEPLRLSVLTLSCLLIAPVFMVFRRYRWGAVVFLVALIGHAFSLGLFLTELKHYFLEVSVSFLAIFALWQAEEHDNVYWPIVMAAVVSLLGFSTLIVSGALLIYAFLIFVRRPWDARGRATLAALFVAGLVTVAAYGYMKYLTVYQLGNYDDYQTTSALGALSVLRRRFWGPTARRC